MELAGKPSHKASQSLYAYLVTASYNYVLTQFHIHPRSEAPFPTSSASSTTHTDKLFSIVITGLVAGLCTWNMRPYRTPTTQEQPKCLAKPRPLPLYWGLSFIDP
jgi:hypothetical protein